MTSCKLSQTRIRGLNDSRARVVEILVVHIAEIARMYITGGSVNNNLNFYKIYCLSQ